MSDPIFIDKSYQPTAADLAAALGPAMGAWDAIVAAAVEICPKAPPAWKHYAGKSGWVFVFREKKRNLLYLSARERSFMAALALNERAVAAAESARLPTAVLKQIRESPVYPEGRAVRIVVASPRQVGTVLKILTLKVAG